jgi:Plasma-membrane choline transporter.
MNNIWVPTFTVIPAPFYISHYIHSLKQSIHLSSHHLQFLSDCLIYFLQEKTSVRHMWVPLVLVGIFAYLVAHCFTAVYEVRNLF